MSSNVVYVGIDVHKSSWTACLYFSDGDTKYYKINNFDSFEDAAIKLNELIRAGFPDLSIYSCYENGPWSFSVHHLLTDKGWSNIVVAGNSIPKTNKDLRHKNDMRDAFNLAYYLSIGKLKGSYIPSNAEIQLKNLVSERKDLTRIVAKQKVWFKQKALQNGTVIHGNLTYKAATKIVLRFNSDLKDSLNKLLVDWQVAHINKSIVQKRIVDLLQQPNFQPIFSSLIRIPGISFNIASELIAYYGDTSRFPSFNAFKSYSGLIPNQIQSGSSNQVYTAKRQQVRSTYHNAAMSLIQHNAEYKSYFESLKIEKKKNTFIKVQQRFAKQIFHLWQC